MSNITKSTGIYDIFLELRENNSKNYKIETLSKYKDNDLLKQVLEYTYSPFKQYYIKQIPEIQSDMNDSGSYDDFNNVFLFLDKLMTRSISGNNAKEQLSYILDHLHPDDAEVLKLILERSINCGMSGKSVNKVWKELIGEIPYMRCSKLTDKTKENISYPALVQLKADGLFANIVKHNNTVYCMTRNGTEFHIGKVTAYFENILHDYDDIVITGELVCYNDGKVIERKISNGLTNSYIKRDATRASTLEKEKKLVDAGKMETKAFKKLRTDLTDKEEEWTNIESMIRIDGWDMIPYQDWKKGKCDIPYSERFANFKKLIGDCDFIDIIPTIEVSSFEEAQNFANEMMLKGLEGGVLKNIDSIWENKTSKNQIKLKAELDADLRVVAYIPGQGDFTGGIGALICRTECGLLEVAIGSGFTRLERGLQRIDEEDMTSGFMLREDLTDIDSFYQDTYHDKILEAKYNEVIKSDGKDLHSLFLPIFSIIRIDKSVADTLERLMET
jgi:ATP-dependent DNA ligase